MNKIAEQKDFAKGKTSEGSVVLAPSMNEGDVYEVVASASENPAELADAYLDAKNRQLKKSDKEIMDKALDEGVNDPRTRTLLYFASGGRVSPDAVQKLFGRKGRKSKNIEGERRARIGLIKRGAPSIEKLSEQISSELGEGAYGAGQKDQEVRNEIEDFILSNVSAKAAKDELRGMYGSPEAEAYQSAMDVAQKKFEDITGLPLTDDIAEIARGQYEAKEADDIQLSNEEKIEILNRELEDLTEEDLKNIHDVETRAIPENAGKHEGESQAKLDAGGETGEVRRRTGPEAGESESQQGALGQTVQGREGRQVPEKVRPKAERLKDAQKRLEKAKAKLREAEDKIAKTQAEQASMFDATQDSLFAVDRDEAKSILDPLRSDVKEAQARVDKIKDEPDIDERQTDLFDENPPFQADVSSKFPPIKAGRLKKIAKAIDAVFADVPGYDGVHVLNGDEFAKIVAEARGGKFNFIGEIGAWNKVHVKLDQAMQWEQAGISPEVIYKKTGWYRDANDGKWRYELPNNAVFLPMDEGSPFHDKKFYTAKLGEVLDYPELYKAYPDFKDITVVVEDLPESTLGRFNLKTKTIHLNGNTSKQKQHKTLRHEIQHRIQVQEGHSGGAGPIEARKRVSEEIRRMDKQARQLEEYLSASTAPGYSDDPVRNDLEILRDRIARIKENFDDYVKYFYSAFAGEIEARNV